MKLDDFTRRHLDNWLARSVFADEQDQARAEIMRALEEAPELLEQCYSWAEIRKRGQL